MANQQRFRKRRQKGGNRQTRDAVSLVKDYSSLDGSTKRAVFNKTKFEKRIIQFKRVVCVKARGREFRQAVLLAFGDSKGHVQIAYRKANNAPDAKAKAEKTVSKVINKVYIDRGTITHPVEAKYKASRIKLMPAPSGTGVRAGGAAKILLELAGFQNISAKSLGSNNPKTLAQATLLAISKIKSVRNLSKIRGKSVDEILEKYRLYNPQDVKPQAEEVKTESTNKTA